MLPHKQQNKPVCSKNKHLLYPPTNLERCRMEGEVGSRGGNARFIQQLLLISVNLEGALKLFHVSIRTATSTNLLEKVLLQRFIGLCVPSAPGSPQPLNREVNFSEGVEAAHCCTCPQGAFLQSCSVPEVRPGHCWFPAQSLVSCLLPG